GGADYYTDVPAGDVAIKNVADLYLYPNTVQAVVITGEQVKNWLEMSSGMFNEVKPGTKDAELLNGDFPSYNFDVIDGVTYQIDLSQPRKFDNDGKAINPDSNRIQDLKFGGKPIDPKQKFVVVTNNYRAGGGGKFPEIAADKVVFQAPDTNRDVIVRFIHDQGTINPSADSNWTFKPLPDTSAVFQSGPKAKQFLADMKSVKIEDAGEGAEGFAKFRLIL
ncbi:5'-nucleotidase C-terminal domain-containing protein, partial [Rhizobium sullae]|uniref:5'-nucleotidase C-terminal domain-containing protein n=1 Tax=Rhizobium sullae TaxID=50338 RepID=UPI0015C63DCE